MKKQKKAKKPMKTILRIGLPQFLAAIILWSCAMVLITHYYADRMLGALPEHLQWISEDMDRIFWNTPGFDGNTNFQELSWWAEDFHRDVRDNCGYWRIQPFPEWMNPFLLDLTQFEFLPPELRYGGQLGIAVTNDNEKPLLATANLMALAEPSAFKNTDPGDKILKNRLLADEPITIFDRTFSSIGQYLTLEANSISRFNHFSDKSRMITKDPTHIVTVKERFQFDDNTYLNWCIGVMCKPVPYCTLRLIPFYCITFVITVLLVGIYLWIIQIKLLNPLHEQAETMDKELPPMTQDEWELLRHSGLCWEEPMAGRSHQIRIKKLLAAKNAEITRMETALGYAKDAEENRKQLISNITHELKTPLAVIHSYAEGIQAGIAAEKKEHYVEVILDEAERMDGMVLQMLELSRLEAGRVKITLESFSFSELVQYVADKFQPLLDAKNLSICLELVEPLAIHASESRLEQVLTNYLSNAVRYSPSGGQILIHASCNQKDLYFNITNTAPHLSPEGLQKVYDSFYREETSRSTKSSGLGLAIVKGIISLHGGECFVSNTELNGESAVHFGFRIPR